MAHIRRITDPTVEQLETALSIVETERNDRVIDLTTRNTLSQLEALAKVAGVTERRMRLFERGRTNRITKDVLATLIVDQTLDRTWLDRKLAQAESAARAKALLDSISEPLTVAS